MIRKLASAFLLMLICSVAASATDTTISTFTINNFQRPGTTAQVRIWYSTNLVDSLGQPVLGGPVGSSIFKIVSCRLDRVTKVLTIPAFTIPSTNDSSAANATVTARIYDSAGRPVTYLWTRWVIPYQLGSTITFAQLNAYNGASAVAPTSPTTNQVGSLISASSVPSSRTTDTTAAADAGPNGTATLVAADFKSSFRNSSTEYPMRQTANSSPRSLSASDNWSEFAKLSATNIFTGTPQTMPAIALTGRGVVFDAGISNLRDSLAIGTSLPQRFGLSAGTNTLPSTSRNPTVSMITYGAPPAGGGGTTVPYYFGYHRKAGSTQPAVYTQLTYATTEDSSTPKQDLVGVASIVVAETGSTSETYAFYGESHIHNQGIGQGAVGAELDVMNHSGVDAPALTSILPGGFTIGLDLVAKGGKYGSAGINFQAASNSSFKTLIHVANDSIAPGGYGLDFKYATRGLPIRLPNLGALSTGYIYGRNNADNADKKLLGITSADQVAIDGDGMGTVFGGNISLTRTITPAGTTGAQTINKTSGSVNFSVGARSLVVTNSFVSNTSVVQCTVAANDVTMKSAQCVAGLGSLTIFANAAPTAETRVNFTVTN
jgi:hypothetical protein